MRVACGCSGVVLPQFDPGVRIALELGQRPRRCPVGLRRQNGAGGEVDSDADYGVCLDAGRTQNHRDALAQHGQIVKRVLQREVRTQRAAAGEFTVQYAIRVGNSVPGNLPAVRGVYQHHPARFGTVVNPQEIVWFRHEGQDRRNGQESQRADRARNTARRAFASNRGLGFGSPRNYASFQRGSRRRISLETPRRG